MPVRLTFRFDDELLTAAIGGEAVTVSSRASSARTPANDRDAAPAAMSVEITEHGDGRFGAHADGQTWSAVAAASGDIMWVQIDGEAMAFTLITGRGTTTADGAGDLTPPMAATVTRVMVHAGARVKQGDILVALEAMKMELPIRAPHDGVVESVSCKEGDLVRPGQELVALARGDGSSIPSTAPEATPKSGA